MTKSTLTTEMPKQSSDIAIEQPEGIGDVLRAVNSTLMDIWQSFVEHTPYLIAGLLVLLLTWIVTIIAGNTVKRALSHSNMSGSLCELILRLQSIGIWTMGLLLAAMFWFPGLTPTTALGGLGLLSVAIGFAFQDIFENFFAGILLLWRFPFEKGDFIECEGIMGEVEEVTVRMTQLRLTTGEIVLLPNAILYKNPVNILTNRGTRRVTVICGVSYDTELDSAIAVIECAVHSCKSVSSHQPVQVFPTEFGSSSIDIEVTWWTESKPFDVRASRAEVICGVKSALDQAGIEIPFPYRTLTFKEPLKVDRQLGLAEQTDRDAQ